MADEGCIMHETVCTARSEHAFLNSEGRFVRMRRDMPEFCQAIEKSMKKA